MPPVPPVPICVRKLPVPSTGSTSSDVGFGARISHFGTNLRTTLAQDFGQPQLAPLTHNRDILELVPLKLPRHPPNIDQLIFAPIGVELKEGEQTKSLELFCMPSRCWVLLGSAAGKREDVPERLPPTYTRQCGTESV